MALSIQRVDLGEGRRGVIDARATAPALALCATGVSNEPPQKVARVVRARGGRFRLTAGARCVELPSGELATAVWAARKMAPRAAVLSLVGAVDADDAAEQLRRAYEDAKAPSAVATETLAGPSWTGSATAAQDVALEILAEVVGARVIHGAGRFGLDRPVAKAELARGFKRVDAASEQDIARARSRAALRWLLLLSDNAERAARLGLAEHEQHDARALLSHVRDLDAVRAVRGVLAP